MTLRTESSEVDEGEVRRTDGWGYFPFSAYALSTVLRWKWKWREMKEEGPMGNKQEWDMEVRRPTEHLGRRTKRITIRILKWIYQMSLWSKFVQSMVGIELWFLLPVFHNCIVPLSSLLWCSFPSTEGIFLLPREETAVREWSNYYATDESFKFQKVLIVVFSP